jgi:Tfp pilus assembly protein PilN
MSWNGQGEARDLELGAVDRVNLLEERQAIRRETFAKSRTLLLAIIAMVVASGAAITPMQIVAAGDRRAAARLENERLLGSAEKEDLESQALAVSMNEDLCGKRAEGAAKTRLWRNVLAELTKTIDATAWLESVTAKQESGGSTLALKGSATSLQSVTRLSGRLKASSLFDQANLTSTQSTGGQTAEGLTHFECYVTISEEATKAARHDVPLRFASADTGMGEQD